MLIGRRIIPYLAVMAISAGVGIGGAGRALAEPGDTPNCTAADLAGITSGVAAASSVYMYTHPDVNSFFTGLKGRSAKDIRAAVQEYLSANPGVREDLRQIRQPMTDFKSRCSVSVEAADVEEGA
ncbi:heme-binding protein [Mycobacteroides abscessus]|uniref:heme-binding protein n=1 Tax=Mycobacteroides abscessus TaxID=36809 RepID=UPI000925F681|nr:heme-binding protein [Mycobacteroides abscessus]MDO3068988.1 heme-binding protein [Mycobacteroides abscessus subsp. bolletii]SHQ49625.1 exported protein [Mycobacteroides abscessus subsp. bolletii]SHR75161.1 exported protein [Mycobacteroides abscessus subsp. bolletii]SHS70651.1 exported protein [Mycobacteroides abscessus subsp. bolletii]SKF80596.1 exported protein [Mycobacteroides abscessus subsp. bolletii]